MKTNYIFKARWLQGAASAIGSTNKRENTEKTTVQSAFAPDSLACRLRVFPSLGLRMAAMFCMLLTLSIGNVWGADVAYKTTTFSASNNSKGNSSYTDTWYNTTDGFRVNIANANNNNNGWSGHIKMGRKNYTSVGKITTNATIDVKITKVSVNINAITSTKINSITLYKSSNNSTWTSLGTFTKSTGVQSLTIAAANQATNQYYKIEFDCASGSSNGLIEVSEVIFYATGYTVSKAVSPSGKATVTLGATTVVVGKTTTATYSSVTAGYEFVNWTISGTGSSLSSTTANPTTITMGTANTTVTANLQCITPTFSSNLSTSKVTYDFNASATALSVTAAAGGATLSYAWEASANGTSGWSSVGTNNKSFTPPTDIEGDMYYRCTVSNAATGCSTSAVSNVAHIFVNDAPGCATNPEVRASSNSSITVGGATLTCDNGSGQAVQKGSCDISEYGFFYNTSGSVSDSDTKVKVSNDASAPFTTNISSFNKAVTGLTQGTHYYFKAYTKVGTDYFLGAQTDFTTKTVTPATNDEDHCLVDIDGNVITVVMNGGYQYASPAYTVSGGSAGSTTTVSQDGDDFTVTSNSTSNITVTINIEPIPTDHYIDAVHSTSGYTGAGSSKQGTYSVPSLSDVSKSTECVGLHYHFAGWVTAANKAAGTISGNIITASGSKTANNTTYYAVWEQEAGTAVYSKITSTSAVVNGVYVIVNNGKYMPSATTDADTPPAAGDTYAVTLSADGSTITSAVSDGMKWNFTMSDGKATIKNAAGSYLYEIAKNNGIRVYTTSDTWTVEENSTGFALKGTNNSRYCAIYNNNDWRSYTEKDHDNYEDGGIVYLYKETIEYEDPVAECAAVTCGTPTTPTCTPSAFGATLGWTVVSPGTTSKFQYAVWAKDADEPTSGYSEVNTNSASVSGLTSNTEYRWKVRKVCTGTDGESGWLKSTFTTTGASLTFEVPDGVAAVAGQSSASALPSADVPSSCSVCWEFAGWTTDAYIPYEDSSAPEKFYPSGSFIHLSSTDKTKLYAVYVQKEYQQIGATSELVANNYYVLTNIKSSTEYAMSNTANASYANDASGTNVNTKVRKFEGNIYLYNVGTNNIWKFTGTSSSGQLYNAEVDKYINLSSTSSPILNTTNNLTFTVSDNKWTIKSTNYLRCYAGDDWDVRASLSAGEFSAYIYRLVSTIYSTAPGCGEHTIAWKKEGVTYSTGTTSTSATACAGIATMPTAPSTSLPCADTFVGWSEESLVGTGNTAPDDLFTTVAGAPKIDEDKTFNAVFATAIGTAIAAVEDTEFSSKSEDGGYGNSTFSFKSVDKYLQKQSIWNSTNMTNVKVKIRVYHFSNSTADVLRVSLINSSGTEVVGTDLTTTKFGTNMNQVGGYSDYVILTPTTAVTGYKVSLKTKNSSGVGINKIEREVVPGAYKDYITGCPNVYTNNNGSGNGQWNTGTNWSRSAVPNLAQPVFIEKPVTVNTTAAQAYSIVIDQSSSKTGSIEINAGQELVVAKTIQKKNASGELVATSENDIVINSSEDDGLGALVMGDYNGTNKATVNFYTKSNGKKQTNTSVAQYVGTPFNDETNILYNWYNSWIYKLVYDESGNIDDWERVNEGDGMEPFKGYCVFSADAWNNAEGHTYWMQGTLVSSANHTCSGLNWQSDEGADNLNNENMLANSWMAPIKISAMQTSDFTNAEATIYIFNSTSNSGYSSLGGNYDTYTVGTSTDVIPAMQSFSVFTKGSSASVTLDYNRIVYAPAVASSAAPIPNYAPRRAGASEDEADKMRLFVRTEDGYGDMLYMWEREDFEEGFENGWDGRKLYGESYAPQLYAITPDGEMAVNCVPSWEGTVLGFKKGTEDNVYTFTFEYEGENTWYLNDLREQTSTLISSESSYMFMASDEDMAARFIISRTPIHSTPTGIEQSAISGQKSAVKKIVIDDHVYIIRNGKMYSAEGVMVR